MPHSRTAEDINKDKFAVSLVNLACPICLSTSESEIVLNTKLTKKAADEVKELHNKTVGLGEPCTECKQQLDNGFVALVEVDSSKSGLADEDTVGTLSQENAYRTGNMAWLKRDVANQLFKAEIKTDLVFVQQGIIDAIKAMVENNED